LNSRSICYNTTNQIHNITSCVEKIQNTQRSPHNPPKLFSIIPKCESIGVVPPPKLSRAMSGWLGDKSKRGGMKFQQHNNSSKKGEEKR
jgi:hypothetical protein